MSDTSISIKYSKTVNENMAKADNWSNECLEHLFNNKIWLPDFVGSEKIRTKINFFQILATDTLTYFDSPVAACDRRFYGPCFCNFECYKI